MVAELGSILDSITARTPTETGTFRVALPAFCFYLFAMSNLGVQKVFLISQ